MVAAELGATGAWEMSWFQAASVGQRRGAWGRARAAGRGRPGSCRGSGRGRAPRGPGAAAASSATASADAASAPGRRVILRAPARSNSQAPRGGRPSRTAAARPRARSIFSLPIVARPIASRPTLSRPIAKPPIAAAPTASAPTAGARAPVAVAGEPPAEERDPASLRHRSTVARLACADSRRRPCWRSNMCPGRGRTASSMPAGEWR